MTETVSIDIREFAELQKLARSGKIAEQVWNDPKHGMKLKQLVKEAIPDANIPELDAVEHAREQASKIREEAFAKVNEVEERLKRFEESSNKRDEDEKQRRIEIDFAQRVEAAKKKYHLTEEGTKKVFERMKEHNNPDVEAAAAYIVSQEPKSPTQPSYAPQGMDLYGSASGDKQWEELNKNPLNFFDKTVAEIMNDPQYN